MPSPIRGPKMSHGANFRSERLIRAAAPGDDRAIADIYLTARAKALSFLPMVHSEAETRAWISYCLIPLSEVQVAVTGQQIIGFIALMGDEIEQLYIAPDHWGQGVGRQLILFAKHKSPEHLALHCFADNTRARRFYERHGFVATGFGDGSGNEEGVPDVRYEWWGDAGRVR